VVVGRFTFQSLQEVLLHSIWVVLRTFTGHIVDVDRLFTSLCAHGLGLELVMGILLIRESLNRLPVLCSTVLIDLIDACLVIDIQVVECTLQQGVNSIDVVENGLLLLQPAG
jgi:hypothetical protein